jgi:precorrin isomerase
MQLASILGENKVKLVPDIAVSGDGGGSGLASAMIAKLLSSNGSHTPLT